MIRSPLLLCLLAGCPSTAKDSADPVDTAGDDSGDTGDSVDADADDDGFLDEVDCDDADPAVHPEADELCNDVDDDCDGATDEDATDAPTWYTDADADGAGDPAAPYTACASTDPATGDDCNDSDATVFPGAVEVCNGVDDDCDPATSESNLVQIGNTTFSSIQAAIDAALDGETVDVCAGSYAEALTVPRSLTLRATLGAEATVIDAGGAGPAVTVSDGDVVIEGFTLTGGTGATREGVTYGGGVYAPEASSVTLVECVVQGNAADRGAGVSGPLMGQLDIQGGSVSSNTATTAGGGVHGGGTVTLTDVDILENTAGDGGGLYLSAGATVSMSGGRVAGNTATGKAGGAYVASGATLATTGTAWDGNLATSYGGAAYLVGATWTMDGDAFDTNESADKGGHVYADLGSVIAAEDTSFVAGTGTWGGAVMLYTATFIGERTTFRSNVSDLGGAFYVYISSALTLTDSTVESNVSGAGAGARVRTTSTLTSTNTGWGEDAADNTPDDIDLVSGETYADFGDAETFTCTNTTGVCE